MESNQPGTLQTLTSEGVAPKSRLATADSARSMLSQLINGDNAASIERTRIQAQIDGASPFSRSQLEKANQSWRANVNWGGARARIRDYLTAYTDLCTSSDTFATVNVRAGAPEQRSSWSQILSEEFHTTLFETTHEWSFLYHMELHHKQLAVHGVGPCYWRDPRDWRFTALKRRNILVPKESPSDASRIPIVFIRDWMYVDEVFGHIAQQRQTSRWNRDACIKAIQNAQKLAKEKFSFEEMQQKWKNNAFDWSHNESDVVNIAHAFVKEFDGRVSHHIFTESASRNNEKPKGHGYLYSKIGEYKSMNEAVWICFQDVGNGDFESVRGLGLEAYHFGEAQNRLNNALIDNGIEAGAVMWQAESPEAANKLTRIEIGAHRMLPPGLTFQQVNTGAGVQSQLAVSNHFSQMEEAGTGVYRSRATTPSNQARTATEVQAEVGQTSKLTNSNVSHYLSQADSLVKETFRRMTRETILPDDGGGQEALEFKRNCIERGVPEEFFHEICASARVTVTRPIGNGSYADRISRISAIGQSIGDMPDRKRRRFIRDRIAYIGGSRELADIYGPDLEEQFPGIEQSLAVLENNGFQGGGTQDPFSPDNSHAVHFPIHYEFAAQVVQDPQMSVQLLGTLPDQPGPLYIHVQQHLQALEGDPTRIAEFKQFSAAWGALENRMKQAAKLAEMAADAEEPTDEPSPEAMKMQAEMQLKAQAAQVDAEIKAFQAKQASAILDAKEAQEIRHKEMNAKQQLAQHQQAMAIAREKAMASAGADKD